MPIGPFRSLPMVTQALRQAMLVADGAGELTGNDVRVGQAEHPICGDLVRLTVRLIDGQITDLAWQAHGCPATTATASVARRALVGIRPEQAALHLRQTLAGLGDLKSHERHAEGLLLAALREACA